MSLLPVQEWEHSCDSGMHGADSSGYGVLTVWLWLQWEWWPCQVMGFPQTLLMPALILARASGTGSFRSGEGSKALVLQAVSGTGCHMGTGSSPVLAAVSGQIGCRGNVVERTELGAGVRRNCGT